MRKKVSYALLISTACGIAYAIHVSLLAGAIGAGLRQSRRQED